MPALAPLMLPIEIVSHLARVLSLTIRLFANMFAAIWSRWFLFAGPDRFSHTVSGTAYRSVAAADLHFRSADTVYLQGAVSEEH